MRYKILYYIIKYLKVLKKKGIVKDFRLWQSFINFSLANFNYSF